MGPFSRYEHIVPALENGKKKYLLPELTDPRKKATTHWKRHKSYYLGSAEGRVRVLASPHILY